MRAISWPRVILGGLLNGLVINGCQFAFQILIYRREWNYSFAQLAVFGLLGFLTGVFALWLYAAIRPRYGPGPKTAVIAGTAVWIAGSLIGGVLVTSMSRLGSPEIRPLLGYWAVCYMQAAAGTLLGARFYREGGVSA